MSFGGKQVDKILIDGKDMFSSGSDGVINNLSAQTLKGAEVLTNYKTGSLIDDFRAEDLTALNLKTDGKIRLSGKVSSMGGIKNKWRENADLLYMGENLYLSSVVSANNVGQAVFSFQDYIRNIIGLDNILSHRGQGINFSQEELSLLMPPQNVYKSVNSLASLSGSFKPNDKFKMQGSLIFNSSTMDAQSLSEQLYYALDKQNIHNVSNRERNKFFSFNLRESYKANENLEFSNLTHISATSLNTDDTLQESGLSDMFSFENSELKKISIQDEAVMNLKTGKGLLSAHLSINNTRRNHSYDLLTDGNILPVSYEQLSASIFALDTKKKINNLTVSPDVTLAYPITKRLKIQSGLAFKYNKNKFSYDDSSNPIDNDLTWKETSLSLSLNKNSGLIQFGIGSEIRNTSWTTNIEGLKSSSQWDILPSGFFTLQFSTSHQLSLSAALENNAIETEYLLRGTIVNGYNSLYKGSVIDNPFAKTKKVNLNYSVFDMYSNTMFFASAGITDNEVTMAHSVQTNTLVSESTYDKDGRMISKFLMANINKGLSFVPIDIRFSANISDSKSKSFLNGNEDDVKSQLYDMSLGFISRMASIINFELSASYSYSEYDYALSNISNSMNEKGLNAGLICVYKNFTGNVRTKRSFLDNSSFDKDYWNLSFRMEYKIKRWRIHISGTNILNIKSMDWSEISANSLYSSTALFRKIPGNILFGLSYRF